MKNLITLLFFIFIAVSTSSCGKPPGDSSSPELPYIPHIPVGSAGPDGTIVMARASIPVSTDNQSEISKLMRSLIMPVAYAANPSNQPVTVVLAPNTSMTMSSASFSTPPVINDILDFGSLAITALSTNDLKKCGTGSNQKCTKAFFRVYTTGTAGAGFYNSTDSYGMPMSVTGPIGTGTVGLNATNAFMVQQITIATNRNTVKLSDFSPVPSYDIKGDFTDAGAGTFSTTIVVEFALAP